MTATNKHFVELNHAENQLLKAATMAFMGAILGNTEMTMAGLFAGQEIVRHIGKDGLVQLTGRLDAHLVATKDDGTVDGLLKRLKTEIADQNAIDELLKGGK